MVKIGDLQATKVVRAKFNKAIVPNVSRSGGRTDASSGRGGIGTAKVVSRWEPPLVDEDWHASCQATCKGVEWENLYYKFVEMNKEVDLCNPSGSSRAKTLWKKTDAKERYDAHDDQTYASPNLGLVGDAAEREELEDVGFSTAGGSRH